MERQPSETSRRPARTTGAALFLAAAAGAAVIYFARGLGDRDGLTRRPGDAAPGRTARRARFGRYAVEGRTVTIARPRSEVYAYWRDFSNLADVMENVDRVEQSAEGHVWTVSAPGGETVTIRSRIVHDKPDEVIAWESTPDSDIETRGKVEFRDAPGGRGTEVTAIISYVPPGGRLGQLAAKLFQNEPAIQARRDLKRLKMWLETGEITTSRNRKAA
ncbi:MAG: SRPBCC family protein [Tranquillimonas sp.]